MGRLVSKNKSMAYNTQNSSFYIWNNAMIIFFVYFVMHLSFGVVITTAEVVKASAGSHSGFFVGATPQNDNEDELYDDADVSEDDFAEFDIDEEEDEEDAEAMVEEEESEFSHFEDDEEFENYRPEEDEDDEFEHKPGQGARADRRRTTPPPPPPKTIKFASVPAHLRNNWENYYLEMLMIAGIVVYFLNFFTGKSKNQRLANAWFTAHKTLLESNL